MKIDLSGKVAVVTGGARDIGRAISLKLAESGAAVMLNYFLSADAAAETVEAITKHGGHAAACKSDVSSQDGAEALLAETRKVFGDRIDILVNNAGGLVARKKLQEMDSDFWDHVLALNLRSVFLTTRATLPYFAEGGAIVNLSSLAAHDGGGPGALAYSAAKGGVLTLTRGLAKELAPRKIRVNCVSPGLIDTTFHNTFTAPEARKAVAGRTLIGREGVPSDVANAVLFLVSDASAYITGESIEINGGLYFV